MLKHTFLISHRSSTQKLFHYILIVTTIFFGDALLTFWLPTYLQRTFSSALVMGLIMSVSSMVGLFVDFFFPQLFPDLGEKKTLNLTLFFQAVFIGLLFLTFSFPNIWIFVLAVAAWGVYFEFVSFANKIYVTDHIKKPLYTNAWAGLDFGKSFAYLLGPIIAGILVVKNNSHVLLLSLFTVVISQLLLTFFTDQKKKTDIALKSVIKPKIEIDHWRILLKNTWPIILLSFSISLTDATFWTSGTVFAETISQIYSYGVFLLPLYVAPMLISQVIMMKRGVAAAKEKKAASLLLFAGFILLIFGKLPIGAGILVATFAIGASIALALPIIEGLYSELQERMGFHSKHLIGLASSTFSLAYIIGPILAGFLSQNFGEQTTFSFIGCLIGINAMIIILFSNKKITLPQQEINTWDSIKK